MATLSANDQIAAAARQLDAAGRAVPLSSIGAERHPSDFLQRPANAIGANARAAYWLAVAARPTASGGATNFTLLNAARQAYALAQAGEPWFTLSSEDSRVDSVLWNAERALASAGRTDVAAIFNQMRGAPSAAGTSAASWASKLATGADLFTPQGRTIGAGTATAVATVAVPVVIGGLVLWFGWPLISEALLAARGAAVAGAASGAGERVRRRFSGGE